MVVFFPFEKPVNPFLEEIEHYFSGTFIFDHYSKLHLYNTVDIIHLHWPEILFDSKLPSQDQFEDFKKHFNTWKSKYKIVYTLHNTKPHISKSVLFIKLYKLISNSVDAVVHFADFSKQEFLLKYPNSIAQHYIIDHPLYLNVPNKIGKEQAKAHFGLDKNTKVVLVFGEIRTKQERQLVLKTFKKLDVKNKFLIASNIGKFRLKKRFGWKLNHLYNKQSLKHYNNKKTYLLENKIVGSNDIQYYFNAADVVFIPRVNSLNSGVLYLACRFNKQIVAPQVGNIKEIATHLKQETYNPKSSTSAKNAIKKSLLNIENNIYDLSIETMHPKIVAKKHYNLYKELNE